MRQQTVADLGDGEDEDQIEEQFDKANPGVTADEIYTFAFTPTKAVHIVVINLTHGTGSEVGPDSRRGGPVIVGHGGAGLS